LFDQVLPFIMTSLPKNDFLNLRLVSRGWKQGLDEVYENHPARLASVISDLKFPGLAPDADSDEELDNDSDDSSHEDLEDDLDEVLEENVNEDSNDNELQEKVNENSDEELKENVNEEGRMVPVVDNGMMFNRLDRVQSFLQETHVNSGNPFPGRCVWISVEEYIDGDEEVDRTELLERFTQLLIRFGDHIWYLRITFDCPDTPLHSTEYETQLMSWLTLVPNLKRLRLELGAPIEGDLCLDLNLDYWGQNPVQQLNNLEVFSYVNDEDQDGIFAWLIQQLLGRFCANGNLKRLHLPNKCHWPYSPFPNLEELWTDILYEDLLLLKVFSPNLKKLVVYVDGLPATDECNGDCEEETHLNIATVFNGLHFFADTLIDLALINHETFCLPTNMDFKVELPKLERLMLVYSPSVKNDILFNLKSLKHLEILDSPMDDYNNGEFVCRVLKRLSNVKTIVIWQHLIEYKPQRFVFRRLC